MTAREAMAAALDQELSVDDPDMADCILAWLWVNGYKLVPLSADDEEMEELTQVH